ncbi:hypothetical protein EVA_15213, partial [gut metagenome]
MISETKKLGGLVRELVLVEVGRALGQEFEDALHENLRTKLVFGGDGQYLGFREQLVPCLHEVSELLLLALV